MTDDPWAWMEEAACKGRKTDEWFPDRGSRHVTSASEMRARYICSTCPVRRPCAQFAYDRGEIGIWGGTDENERGRARARTGFLRSMGQVVDPMELLIGASYVPWKEQTA